MSPSAPSLCDPGDGTSPCFGMKTNLSPSCPWWGSINNITKNLRKQVSCRRRWGHKQKPKELRRVSPEKRQLWENPNNTPAQGRCRQ